MATGKYLISADHKSRNTRVFWDAKTKKKAEEIKKAIKIRKYKHIKLIKL